MQKNELNHNLLVFILEHILIKLNSLMINFIIYKKKVNAIRFVNGSDESDCMRRFLAAVIGNSGATQFNRVGMGRKLPLKAAL